MVLMEIPNQPINISKYFLSDQTFQAKVDSVLFFIHFFNAEVF